MKSGTTPPNPGDDLTSAAESLLGIDLSSSHVPSGPIDLDDSDLFGEPDAEAPSAAEPEVAAAESEVAAAEPEVAETVFLPAAADDDFGSDFGAGLDAIPEPAPAVPRRPAPVAAAKPAPRAVKPSPQPVQSEPEAEEQPAAPAAAAPRKDDSYWDALEGWDWGEESGTGKSESSERAPGPRDRGRSRGGAGSRSGGRRDERSAPSSPPRPRRAPVEDDFGSGIDDEPASNEREPEPDPDVSVFGLSPTESQADFLGRSDERTDERFGARRSGEFEDVESRSERESEPDPDVSVFGLDPTESQVRFLQREPERRSEPPMSRPAAPPRRDLDDVDDVEDVEDVEDGFGAGLDEMPSSERRRTDDTGRTSEPVGESDERGARRGRRRRGRGRGRDAERRETGDVRAPEVSRREPPRIDDDVDAVDDEPRADEIADSADFGTQESRFTDVPTWAEAIGLLVKSRGGPAESAGGGERGRGRSGTSSESGERGGGGRGRGRGGRRGGGRRRSE